MSGFLRQVSVLGLVSVFAWSLVSAAADSGTPAGRIEGLTDLAGNEVSWNKNAEGKPAVFLFVRTDCPISNAYAPAIERLRAKFATRVAFWLVYLDPAETSATIRKHQEEFQLRSPALRDMQHEFVAICGARVTPEAAVFNAERKKVYIGRIDDRVTALGKAKAEPTSHDLEAALTAVLAGRPPPRATAPAVGCLIADLR